MIPSHDLSIGDVVLCADPSGFEDKIYKGGVYLISDMHMLQYDMMIRIKNLDENDLGWYVASRFLIG